MNIIQNFLVLEGGDGTGTSTQIKILAERLGSEQRNFGFFPTFEPTEGEIGVLLRKALRRDIELTPQTIARLFAADRSEHLYGHRGIIERCGSGQLVVSDRYTPSSLVYQGIECGDELPRKLNEDFPYPEMLLYFEIDPETALKRVEQRKTRDIYEYLDFQEKAHARYRKLLPEYESAGVRVIRVDASGDVESVAREVWSALEKLPIMGI
ncbi:dTMP kinase [Breznakiella homolactica]|uniref:Thymidylate kinase n=1 Tax=Breznakiella homolactica TaxID=2798577 RepID=A0A7T7XKR1_9SPIR|nr:dTMP kinase [Breznakiella homolactica]QQO08204.1 dTMP kinase [Breznakiella homolactica]